MSDSDEVGTTSPRRGSRRTMTRKSYKVEDNSSGEEIEPIEAKKSKKEVKKVRTPLKIKNDDEEFVPFEEVATEQKTRKRKPAVKRAISVNKPAVLKRTKKISSPDSGIMDSNNNMERPGSSKGTPKKQVKADDSDSDDDDGWEDECEIPEAVDLENYKP